MNKPDYLDEADDVQFDCLVEAGRKRHVQLTTATNLASISNFSASVQLQSAASIVPHPIEWLWPGWLARGRLHILGGQPGTGKTTLALEIAAIISSASNWPDGVQAKQGSVVIWSGEDDPADTLVPRLIAARAGLRRIHLVRSAHEGGQSRAFDPARDMGALEKEIQRVGDVALVVIDPVALIATKDSHKNAETRRDLQPLSDLCRLTGAAALGVHHLAKGTAGREPQERLIGSVAFAAVARVVMIAAKQPAHDGAPERRILMRAKSNIGPDEGGFAYGLEQLALEQRPDVLASRVVWGEPIEGSARDAFADAERPADERRPVEKAKDFLRDLLADGPIGQKEVKSAAEGNGHSWATVRRAKDVLRIQALKTGFGDAWAWSLPKVLTDPKDAHQKEMSAFAGSEHLRGQNSQIDEVEF
jgi:putative DNA primase/helicase